MATIPNAEPAVDMDWGPWVARIDARPIGYWITIRNNWMTYTNDFGGWRAWTLKGARRKARRLIRIASDH